jgi:HEAT repeat protein
MTRALWLFAAAAFVLFALAVPGRAAPPADDTAADEQLLKGAKVATDGPALLAYLRKRVLTEADSAKVAAAIAKLGDEEFKVREQASADLIAIGPAALGPLRQAMTDGDAEVKRRARVCINTIEGKGSVEVEAAAVRLVKVRKPADACAALLYFMSAVADAGVEEEVLNTLLVVGIKDGKADAALRKALEDKLPARRAAAAVVLGKLGDAGQRKAVAKLLTDADLKVRLRAAQGLLAAKDKSALAQLLPLLTDAPLEVAQLAEGTLAIVAGDKAPTASLGDNDKDRRKCRDAWEGWWKANEAKLDLAKANVDLPWLNMDQQARTATTKFIDAILKGDIERLKKTTDIPFTLMGQITHKDRDELDNFLAAAFKNRGEQPQGKYVVISVAGLEDYRKTVQGPLKDFLKDVPRGEFRAVFVTLQGMGKNRQEKAAVLVRVRGGRGRVIGIGEPVRDDKPGKK